MCRVSRTGFFTGTAIMLCGFLVAGCTPDYSPNTYASSAAQLANKVDQGVVVGVRAVQISADTTLATATGGAAGGVIGSQVGAGSTVAALGAVGGTVAGGLVGNVVGHAAGDTDGFEYIVKKENGDLLSVTQKDAAPLGIGAHVLIIEGPQARIVADYTVPVVSEPLHPEAAKPATAAVTPPATAVQSSPPVVTSPAQASAAVVASPLPPPTSAQPNNEQKPASAPNAETLPVAKPDAKPDDPTPAKPSGS